MGDGQSVRVFELPTCGYRAGREPLRAESSPEQRSPKTEASTRGKTSIFNFTASRCALNFI